MSMADGQARGPCPGRWSGYSTITVDQDGATVYTFARLFAKLPRPGDSDVTFAVCR